MKRAASYCDDVEFSPEDACRTEHDFLCRVVEAAIDAGATTINVPDTVGYATPGEVFDRFKMLRDRVPNMDKAVLSTHCHDDLGMAVANPMAAVAAGAGQIECTINGIGERAGNAALEEIVMAMKTRQRLLYGCRQILTRRVWCPSVDWSATRPAFNVQRNKAIVGRNAFAHESGIHQDGMLEGTQHVRNHVAGGSRISKTDLVLGKHSGRAALADRAKQLGFTLNGEQLHKVFDRFKVLADKKKEIYDGDIVALVQQQISGP